MKTIGSGQLQLATERIIELAWIRYRHGYQFHKTGWEVR
jgi:hypothetical protein